MLFLSDTLYATYWLCLLNDEDWCHFILSNHPDAESFKGPSGVLASLLWKCSWGPWDRKLIPICRLWSGSWRTEGTIWRRSGGLHLVDGPWVSTGGEWCSNGGRALYKQSSVGGTYHLGKGGIREGDTDSDNVKAGVEELLSPVWRRRARVVLRKLGGWGWAGGGIYLIL